MSMIRTLIALSLAINVSSQDPSTDGGETVEDSGISKDGLGVEDPAVCKGEEVVYRECPNLPPCGPCQCKVVNCEFAPWGDWGPPDGCNGLCKRVREIKMKNSECGKPCDGDKEDTKECLLPECQSTDHSQDCVMEDWGPWTECVNGDIDQKSRSRKIKVRAQGHGKPCTESTVETFPCGHSLMPLDCRMGDWQDWTICSVSCGGGIHSRVRRPVQEAEHGGKTCGMALQETGKCKANRCEDAEDCEMSDWGGWTGCDASSPNEKYRRRSIASMPSHGGAACNRTVKEVADCHSDKNPNCTIGDWSDWSACDADCGGGQTRRTRTLISWTAFCTNISTEEINKCSSKVCEENAELNCELSEWSEWGQPAPPCGKGVKDRKRKVVKTALEGGTGCLGPLEQIMAVNGPECTVEDCVWGDWAMWSGCSASCGGGTHRRTRSISNPPRHGGTLCEDNDFAEIQPCSTQPCDTVDCINGTWGLWSEWSECSTTCGTGYKVKRREAAQVANSCGTMQSGAREELEQCENDRPCEETIDCMLSEWGKWGECSASCFGVRERNRLVEKFPMGGGKQCTNESLKDVEPCNPAYKQVAPVSCQVLPMKNCTLEDWTAWSECPVTCGSGQHTRKRTIIQPPSGGGMTCNTSLSETRSCATNKCGDHCIDCHWGQWGQWGACTGKCNGQKYRTRRVEQLPNNCGRRCDARSAKETAHCSHKDCASMNYCAWSKWSAYTECSATCGASSMKRQRTLRITQKEPPESEYLFKGKEMMCAGTQFETEACPEKPVCGAGCIPQNCIFDFWSEWQAPQCTGLCQRVRVIRINNNICGTPCEGDMVSTKRCNTTCDEPQDCVIGDWGSWSRCPTMYDQRYRVRVIKVEPANDGEQCAGALRETTSCMEADSKVVDCGFTDWTDWGACTKTCGNGWHYRTRSPNSPPPLNLGAMCSGSLKEIASCGRVSCEGETRECSLASWGAWSSCTSSNQVRTRIVSTEAVGEGAPCEGSMTEMRGCDDSNAKVDCQISPWTAWDECDMSCGGGQQMRHRLVWAHPRNGGKACETNLMETQACMTQDCGAAGFHNCSLSDWTPWGKCSTTCGVGMSIRQRSILKLRAEGGIGCHTDLKEAKPCDESGAHQCAPQDCIMETWSQWGECSKHCDGGQKSRKRFVKQNAQPGGRACLSETMEELEPCNVRDCNGENCVDGVWGDWQAWTTCSQPCGGGITWRNREIAVTATDCGAAALGPEQEVASCNRHVHCGGSTNCAWNDWGPWGACSSTCHGQMSRKRSFKPGTGNGEPCHGNLQEWRPCSPGPGEETPLECPEAGQRVDCKFQDWKEWGPCSKKCGGGQATRSRGLNPKAIFGGKACVGVVDQTGPCATIPCTLGEEKVDCKWQDWGAWGACDKCAGTKRRSRMIASHATPGGVPCSPGDSKQVEDCPRECKTMSVCEWSDWSEWGPCSRTCGFGHQKKSRNLVVKQKPGQTSNTTTSGEETDGEGPNTTSSGEETDGEGPSITNAPDTAAPSSSGSSLSSRLYQSGLSGLGETAGQPVRLQELAGAFAGGMISLLVVMAAARTVITAWTRMRQGNEAAASQPLRADDERHAVAPLLREEGLE